MGAFKLNNGPETVARIRAEGREPLIEHPPSYADNDNRPQRVSKVPGSSFTRFVDDKFEQASYLIKDILPLRGVALLAGQYSSGKTFVALDIALSLICGEQFLGCRTKQGAVLWFAAEGAGTVAAIPQTTTPNGPRAPFKGYRNGPDTIRTVR